MSDSTSREHESADPAPATTSGCHVALFRCGGLSFAFPKERILAKLAEPRITPLPWCPGFVRGSLAYDGHAVAVLDPAAFLGVAGSPDSEAAAEEVVLFTAAGTPLGLLGCSLGERPAEPYDGTNALLAFAGRGLRCVRGCVQVDGVVIPLLDPDGFGVDGDEPESAARDELDVEPEELLLERARALSQTDASPAAASSGAGRTVVFPLGDEWYGVPAASVREIHQPRSITRLPGAPPFLTGVANLRGDIIAVLDLLAMTGGRPMAVSGGALSIVVIRHQGRDFGIRCEAGAEVVDVAEDSMQALPSTAGATASALAKGVARVDGRLACLLDLSAVLGSPALARFLSSQDAAPGEQRVSRAESRPAAGAPGVGTAADDQAGGARTEAAPADVAADAAEAEQIAKYREMFLQVADEMLQELDSTLLEAEKRHDDREVVNAAFRAAHSLKGAAASVDLATVARISHAMESILGAAREGKTDLSPDTMDVLLRAGDSVRDLIEAARGGQYECQEDPPILGELAGLLKGEPATGPMPTRPQEQPKAQHKDPSPTPPPSGLDLGDSIRVPMPKLDALWNISGELLTQQTALEAHVAGLEMAAGRARDLAEAWGDLALGSEGPAEPSSHLATAVALRADGQGTAESAKRLAERLDALLLEAGAIISYVGIAANELRADVLNLRMLPVSAVFKTYERLVRDLARAQGKDVVLETSGGDTELDKRVLEEVGEALMHLARNAVDHGLESPEARRAAGKRPQGVVRLAARHEGGEVVIEISDDGRGVDLNRLRAKAVTKGLVSEEEAAALNDSEVGELMFAPGMTTRDEVSDTSGRGVGMDIVRANIERLKGSIETRTVRGQGTTFRLRVPLTLGIIHGLFVHVAGELLCLPGSSVVEVLRLNRSELAWAGGVSTTEYQGGDIPVLPLSVLLGLDEAGPPPECEWMYVLVIQHNDHRVGLVVDRVVAELEIVVKNLGSLLRHVPSLFGATILGDGRIAVILDVPSLVRGAERSGASVSAGGKVEKIGAQARQRILVVEDSIFTRELLRSILEVAGYEVVVTTDGMDALQAIERQSVDLVVTDIEMPRMDGIELTRTLRSREGWREVPVVIVTAQASDDERKRGVDAGADAYIIKGAFDQHSLVQAVEELIG